MKRNQIEIKKEVAELFRIVEQASKPDHCLLCGKKDIPICYSHIVPQFILKGIADSGWFVTDSRYLIKRAIIFKQKRALKMRLRSA